MSRQMKRRSISRGRTGSTNKDNEPNTNNKTPKKKPYIKKYATPDRPPPAAAMLVEAEVIVVVVVVVVALAVVFLERWVL